ncbi:MAG: hypothetical protein Kow0098_03480 [Ignavibacteriaceae bacterium]
MIISLKSKCPNCNTVRVLWGPFTINNPDDLAAAEILMDIKGGAKAVCPECNVVEDVALFDSDTQTEDWMNADEYEKTFGKAAGELPPKPGDIFYKRKQLGKIIADRRKQLNLSQEDIAKKTGLSIITIKRLEAGKFWINLKTLFQICNELKLLVQFKELENKL